MTEHRPWFRGASWVGATWGLGVGLTPWAQPIETRAKASLGLGLGLTYASVGLLVDWLPAVPGLSNWLRGLLVGVAYSVPGAVFTTVPYPLKKTAPRYWREFAAGGPRAFFLTLAFGGLVGLTCGLAVRDRSEGATWRPRAGRRDGAVTAAARGISSWFGL